MNVADIAARMAGGKSGRLPVIQQSELSECGLACLAMIARYHGHDIDLAALRRRHSISMKGAKLGRIIDIAEKLGFEARPLRVELDYLAELRTPCILHWNFNHFVVLKRAGSHALEIHDPARGAIKLSRQELSRQFTGVALELEPAADFKPVSERQHISLRALAGKVYGLRRAISLVLVLAVALEIFTLALPLAMQGVLDHVLVAADWDLLHLLGLGFLTVVVFQTITMAMRGWVVASLGASMNAQWVTNLFGHMLRLPMVFFEKRHVGAIMSRFFSLNFIQQTLTGSFVEIILDGLTAILVLVVLTLYNPMLTLLVIVAFLLYSGLRWLAYRRLWRLNEEALVFMARQQSRIIETMRGIQAIKLANKQGERRTKVTDITVEVANRQARIQRLTATFNALNTGIFGLQRILLIWIGAYLTLQGQLTAGMLVVFVTYADMFGRRAGALIDRLVEFRLLGLHGQRIADIALEPPEQHMQGHYSGPIPEATIEIENLGFRYAEDEPWVLRHCNFTINAGQSLAIVGPSGCGKTTLAKLILGLLQPDEGTIRIGGIDIRRFGLSNYRELFGAVMQEDGLFEGSLADNIAFFDPDGGLPELEQAARAACIHDDIAAMPMGYETLVGDMGSALSGGQKQRVLLARALYRKPRVLLLDEATSHLDVDRERDINRKIAQMKITRIVIAHRPETIASADRVIAIQEGRSEALTVESNRLANAISVAAAE